MAKCRIKGCTGVAAIAKTPDMAGLCKQHQQTQSDRWAQNAAMSKSFDDIWRGHEQGLKSWQADVGRMSEAIVDVLLEAPMNRELAQDILVSYCIGNRKYHTIDTVNALSWALGELDRCKGVQEGEEDMLGDVAKAGMESPDAVVRRAWAWGVKKGTGFFQPDVSLPDSYRGWFEVFKALGHTDSTAARVFSLFQDMISRGLPADTAWTDASTQLMGMKLTTPQYRAIHNLFVGTI
jgi:hypothetical protein